MWRPYWEKPGQFLIKVMGGSPRLSEVLSTKKLFDNNFKSVLFYIKRQFREISAYNVSTVRASQKKSIIANTDILCNSIY